jgi:hypothetical protein
MPRVLQKKRRVGTNDMKIPILTGIIRRRILVNFRADPDVIQSMLPNGFRPKIYRGHAIVGICLIGLSHVKPKCIPGHLGISSENASHRIAVQWDENGNSREGVYIPRRDTDSVLNSFAGGRIFPGEHHRARFEISESQDALSIEMHSVDRLVHLALSGGVAGSLPKGSIFGSADEAVRFFRSGSLGYSITRSQKTLEGVTLILKEWKSSAIRTSQHLLELLQ